MTHICPFENEYTRCFVDTISTLKGRNSQNKCAACAFEEGYKDGLLNSRRNPQDVIVNLPNTNTKEVANVELAYLKGVEIGNKVFCCIERLRVIEKNKKFSHNKKNKLLQTYLLDEEFYICIYQGTKTDFDYIVKYRQLGTKDSKQGEWTQERTPKHIHWAVDILLKQVNDAKIIDSFLKNILDNINSNVHYPILIDKQQRDTFLAPKNILKYVFMFEEVLPKAHFDGEYSLGFLILLCRLLLTQERTNYPNGNMFDKLLETLKERKSIFSVVSSATFR